MESLDQCGLLVNYRATLKRTVSWKGQTFTADSIVKRTGIADAELPFEHLPHQLEQGERVCRCSRADLAEVDR